MPKKSPVSPFLVLLDAFNKYLHVLLPTNWLYVPHGLQRADSIYCPCVKYGIRKMREVCFPYHMLMQRCTSLTLLCQRTTRFSQNYLISSNQAAAIFHERQHIRFPQRDTCVCLYACRSCLPKKEFHLHLQYLLECAGSNNESVAEDEILRMLLLIRNFVPAHEQIVDGVWDVPHTAGRSWDLKGKTIGTVGGGRIGYEVLRRLDVSISDYFDEHNPTNFPSV